MTFLSWIRSAIESILCGFAEGQLASRRSVWRRVTTGVREIQPLEQKCLLSSSSVAQFDEALQPFIVTDSSGNIQYNAFGSQDLSSLSPEQRQQLLYGPWQSNTSWSLSPPVDGDISSGTMGTDVYEDAGDSNSGGDYGIDYAEGGEGILPVGGDTIGDDYGYEIYGLDMPLPDGGADYGNDGGVDIGDDGGVDGSGGDSKVEIQFKDLETRFLEGPYSRSKLDRARLRFERSDLDDDPSTDSGSVILKFTGTAKLGEDFGLADSAGELIPLAVGPDGTVQIELNNPTGVDTFYLVSSMDGDYELDESVIITIVGVSPNAKVGANNKVNSTLVDFTGDVDLNSKDEDAEDKPGVDIAWNTDDDNLDKKPDYQDGKTDLTDNDFVAVSMTSHLLETTDYTPYAQLYDYVVDTAGYFVLDFDSALLSIYQSDGSLVMPGVTRFPDQSPLPGLKAEGIAMGVGKIELRWVVEAVHPAFDVYSAVLDSLIVNVWGVDADIDSDNNNGFSLPVRRPWEDYIENDEYAIGKMLSVDDPEFTPVIVQLPRGLDPADRRITVSIDLDVKKNRSGSIDLWNTQKANVTPGAQGQRDVTSGGNRIAFVSYFLTDLGYNSTTGDFVIWVRATEVTEFHDKKLEVDQIGKPEDSLTFTVNGAAGLPEYAVKDEVKYMVVVPGSFYPVLNASQPIRNAFAAELVYGKRNPDGSSDPAMAPKDDPRWALRLITEEELTPWLDDAVNSRFIEDAHRQRVLAVLFGHEGSGEDPEMGYVDGLAAALYLDYCSGAYVLSFRGTNFTEIADWLTNLSAGAGSSRAHKAAQEIAWALARTPFLFSGGVAPGGLQVTGHSLGGGLAAAGTVAARATGKSIPLGNIHADTFNAAGIWERLFMMVTTPTKEYFLGSLAQLQQASTFIDAYNVGSQFGGVLAELDPSVVDILTWVQRQFNGTINLGVEVPVLADAVGRDRPVVGLHEFTEAEFQEFRRMGALIQLLRQNSALALVYIADAFLKTNFLGIPTGLDQQRLAILQSALEKMADAHSMENILHGLMVGPGVNVYE